MNIYSKPNCPNCEIVKSQCALRGIAFTEIVLDSEDKIKMFKALHANVRAVPFVTHDDGTVIGGFSKFKEYLRTL